MSDSELDDSTHNMVRGLHRRFDGLEQHVDALKSESRAMGESIIKLSGRVDLAERTADLSAEREKLVNANLSVALESQRKSLDELKSFVTASHEKLFSTFSAHTTQEDDDRKKLLFWIKTAFVSGVLGVVWTLVTRAAP